MKYVLGGILLMLAVTLQAAPLTAVNIASLAIGDEVAADPGSQRYAPGTRVTVVEQDGGPVVLQAIVKRYADGGKVIVEIVPEVE
ncbi:MAG: hypothetical protein R3221_00735 [Spongiibacter sp.]|nr:hypothetical protein [Spongiibacter sp.]